METGGATGDVDMGPDVDMASDDNDADLLVEVLLWERRLLKALASVSEGVQQQLTIAASIPFVVTESYAGCCTASYAFSRSLIFSAIRYFRFPEARRRIQPCASVSELRCFVRILCFRGLASRSTSIDPLVGSENKDFMQR